jgi:N6-adenosine-specific RNA methylase IME4
VTLPWHPLANLFPLIEGGDYQILVDDLRQNGLRDPIILLDGMILDGRNRARACEDAQVPPRYEPFAGKPEEAVAYVLSKNLARRHLNDAQRTWIASRLCGDEPPFGGLLAKEAAERLHVKLRSVERASAIRKKGAPVIKARVEAGDLPIATAAGIAEFPEDVQVEIIDRATKESKGPIARRALTLLKQQMRSKREKDKGHRQIENPEGVFGLILEDFEWDHATWSEAGKDSRHPSNHYQTSSDAHTAEEIVRRTAERFACADEHCILWMWATIPHLAIALDVMRLRGFEYRSHYIWNKDRIITGYWSRARHEILLMGVRGKIDCPAQGTQADSVINAPLGKHSAKPEAIVEMIERYYPTLPKLELNARRRRPGWQAWGDEIEPAADWRLCAERAAIERGLIDRNGMVRTGPDAVVAFDFVTQDEWDRLLTGAAVETDAETIDPSTGEILDDSKPETSPPVIEDAEAEDHSALVNPIPRPEAKPIEEEDDLTIPAFLRRATSPAEMPQ